MNSTSGYRWCDGLGPWLTDRCSGGWRVVEIYDEGRTLRKKCPMT